MSAEHCLSTSSPVLSGVRQGFVMDPFIFFMFIDNCNVY